MSRELYLQQIGEATVSFSHLDLNLTTLICRAIIKDKPFGKDGMTFGEKINFLDKELSINDVIHVEMYSKLKDFIPKLRSVNLERKRIIHNVWYLHESEDLAISHNIGYSKEVNVDKNYYHWQEIKLEDLINHVKKISELYLEISSTFTTLLNLDK